MGLFERGKWGIIANHIICRMFVVDFYVSHYQRGFSKYSEMARKEEIGERDEAKMGR
jgi:hypothetical protein|tara:strand:+ start:147 stop:317 length:171 start_codon:yes stop_codon:yes gene_type:complete